ncbi:hypothetical protein NDS46_01800 [Paenibacillus thiaminolyticus]|uniref:hypothetical protein n=1 Tax=Paenibacillus thiaminolyticus TaxID=49283 RepID=UPI00232F8EF3|nr:hypothetical protein [Paenibacillus thiaminolyticus]WCF08679.1 hypothetical protein NDS46_01800 [Paenibacillus thiaminolyticus]
MESLNRWEIADTGCDRPADATDRQMGRLADTAERKIDMNLTEGESDQKGRAG